MRDLNGVCVHRTFSPLCCDETPGRAGVKFVVLPFGVLCAASGGQTYVFVCLQDGQVYVLGSAQPATVYEIVTEEEPTAAAVQTT